MIMSERLSRHDRDLLLDIIDCCHVDEPAPDFLDVIHTRLRTLLPYRKFFYGQVRTDQAQSFRSNRVELMNEHPGLGVPAESVHHCPMLGRWVSAQRPIYYDQSAKRQRTTADQPCAAIFAEPTLASLFSDLEMRNIAVHGVMDVTLSAATCYAFVHLEDPWDARAASLLRIVIPHLYSALRVREPCPAPAPNETRRKPLTERELCVLHWLSHGKSSVAIGAILDISTATVNAHTQNIVHKLGADNRAHAVALALRTGIIGL
jgi:DNA-binding CsgD family transcriptional regulator